MEILAAIILTISCALIGAVVGAESASVRIHAAIDEIPGSRGRRAVMAVNHAMGTAMPVVMPITLAVTLIAALLYLPQATAFLGLVAALGVVGMILITLIGLAPLNKQEESGQDSLSDEQWDQLRTKWNGLNRFRLISGFVALIFIMLALFTAL